MSCSLLFWLFGIGSLLTGALLSWLFTRNKSESLTQEINVEKRKTRQLEEEYAALRTSHKTELDIFKSKNMDLKNSLLSVEADVDNDLKAKYDQLRSEYDNLLAIPVAKPSDPNVVSVKDFQKLQNKYDKLLEDYNGLSINVVESKDEALQVGELASIVTKSKKKKGKKKIKKIKQLKRKVARLKSALKEEEENEGIKKEVEIKKSLRVNKLLDWLKKDKAYKVKKKVSTKKLKN